MFSCAPDDQQIALWVASKLRVWGTNSKEGSREVDCKGFKPRNTCLTPFKNHVEDFKYRVRGAQAWVAIHSDSLYLNECWVLDAIEAWSKTLLLYQSWGSQNLMDIPRILQSWSTKKMSSRLAIAEPKHLYTGIHTWYMYMWWVWTIIVVISCTLGRVCHFPNCRCTQWHDTKQYHVVTIYRWKLRAWDNAKSKTPTTCAT